MFVTGVKGVAADNGIGVEDLDSMDKEALLAKLKQVGSQLNASCPTSYKTGLTLNSKS